MGADTIHHIESSAELNQLMASTTYVAVDFFADWCPPCKVIAPVYEKLATQHGSAWHRYRLPADAVLQSGKFQVCRPCVHRACWCLQHWSNEHAGLAKEVLGGLLKHCLRSKQPSHAPRSPLRCPACRTLIIS